MEIAVFIDHIRFTHKEGYLPTPRCRKLRYRDATAETTAEVALLTEPDTDAPVAFRYPDWHLTLCMGFDFFADVEHRVKKEIRLYNGQLYERDHWGNHSTGCSGWYDFETLKKCIRDYDHYSPQYSFALGKCPETREEYLKDIKARAGEILLMMHAPDDIGIWIKCGEPRYMYNTFGLGHNHGGTGLFIEQWYNSNIPNTHYFNALQREEAVKAACETALRRGDDESIESIKLCETIEVLMPEAVHVDPMQQHGEGDSFINILQGITETADSATEAGILVMCATEKAIADAIAQERR